MLNGVAVDSGAAAGGRWSERSLWASLDFVLMLGESHPPRRLLESPQGGTWTFSSTPHGVPPGFWAIARREDVVRSSLVRLDSGGGTILRDGWYRVIPHSLAATVDGILGGMARLPALAARDLALGGARPATQVRVDSTTPSPRPLDRARRLAVSAAAAIRRFEFATLRRERWNVGIFDGPLEEFLARPRSRPVRWVPGSDSHAFVADPFPVPGTDAILVERWDHRAGLGTIAALDLSGDAREVAGFIADDLHYSYPFVFRDGSDVYCAPEAAEGRGVRLFRMQDTPGRWEHVDTLLPGVAALDSTLFRHDGRWWLACADWDVDYRGQLFLWFAEDLKGPWQAHRRNPVKIDPRSARPAGTPLLIDGVLHRPAQDCARVYGARVSLQRINRLSPDEFDEEEVASIEPDPKGPYPDGLHTLASDGRITVIDGKRHEFHPTAFIGHLRKWRRARRYGF